MSKKNTNFSSFTGFNLKKECENILDEYREYVNNLTNSALDAAAELMQQELANAAPLGNGEEGIHLKTSMTNTKKKYRMVRYIGSPRVNQNGISVMSLLEFSVIKGKPFVRKTFDKNKKKIFEIIKGEINNG